MRGQALQCSCLVDPATVSRTDGAGSCGITPRGDPSDRQCSSTLIHNKGGCRRIRTVDHLSYLSFISIHCEGDVKGIVLILIGLEFLIVSVFFNKSFKRRTIQGLTRIARTISRPRSQYQKISVVQILVLKLEITKELFSVVDMDWKHGKVVILRSLPTL
jgi:hypothetical protein